MNKVNISISHVWTRDTDLKTRATLGIYVSGKLVVRVGKEHRPDGQAAEAQLWGITENRGSVSLEQQSYKNDLDGLTRSEVNWKPVVP